MKRKIILDLCGGTGSWSKPYQDAGYDVRLITLPEYDIRFYEPPENVYGILSAPPCIMFSYARTKAKKPRNLQEGMNLVISCLRIIWHSQYEIESDVQKKSPLAFWALENPNGMLKWFLGKPVFQFDPYDFGDQYQKRTYLWGYFNKPKKSTIELTERQKKLHRTNSQPLPTVKFDHLKTKEIHPNFYGKLNRQARRAITPSGFALAFFEANQ